MGKPGTPTYQKLEVLVTVDKATFAEEERQCIYTRPSSRHHAEARVAEGWGSAGT